MKDRDVSTLLERSDQSGKSFDAPSTKRVQGRPVRGGSEVGAHKIVEAMRSALRALQTAQVSRKDVAGRAGVTPALVTYYFPERTRLIEAATLPVVQDLVDRVRACTKRDGPARHRLCRAIEILLEFYARDAAVIALYDQHRASTPDAALPDLSKDLDGVVESVFEAWLIDNPGSLYDATFLRKAMIGACKTLARRRTEASPRDALDHQDRRRSAEMMCSLLMGPSCTGALPDAPTSVDSENCGLQIVSNRRRS